MDRGLVNATGRARGRNDAAYPAETKGAAQGIITCPVTHRGATKDAPPWQLSPAAMWRQGGPGAGVPTRT